MEEPKKSGLATAGLVLGMIGICTSFIPIINHLSFIIGMLAIIFGIIALAKEASKGKTIAAIILGILTIIITISSQKAMSDSRNEFGKDLDKMLSDSTEEVLENKVDVKLMYLPKRVQMN